MASTSQFQMIFWFMILLAWEAKASPIPGVFSIEEFGAIADGKTDNSKAFLSAWNQACARKGTNINRVVIIPQGTYLTGPLLLRGPCMGRIVFYLKGLVKAPIDLLKSNSWITFEYIDRLTITGGGTFDGQGELAWAHNRCSNGGSCEFPHSIRFNFVTNSIVREITSKDSKLFHINLLGCNNLKFQSIRITAPANSVNTDGIHIGHSKGVEISNSIISTGDDCISLGPGSNDISITKVSCGPGHGISIGSLGKSAKEEPVIGIVVRGCTFKATENGVRIKTWPDSAAGIASNLTFEDILMDNVNNPIVIDQQYCPYSECNRSVPSRVKISNVIFKNIRGTSASKLAIDLFCSKGVPCQNVELSDIDLRYTGKDGPTTSSCANVKPIFSGKLFPPTCV